MHPRTCLFAATLILTLAAPVAACPCPADADGNGTVDFGDVLVVLANWGPCEGCPGDVNHDNDVNFEDLLAVLAAWGPCRFEYEPLRDDAEAEQIGLEMLGSGGVLRVPDDRYERIVRDQALIREAERALVGEIHSPAWVATDLIIKKVPEAPADEYDAFNAYFQLTSENHLFGDWYVLTFPHALNAPAMSLVYAGLDSIEFAEPNGIFGGDNSWVPTPIGGDVWRWNIDDGFCDCFDGCDCHFFYEFEVDGAGNVELTSFEDVTSPCCLLDRFASTLP